MKTTASGIALMFALYLGVAISGTGVSGMVMADETDASQTAEVSKPERAKRICRKEPVMGSNIKRTTCRTQKQIDEQREASQKSMGDFSSQAVAPTGRPVWGEVERSRYWNESLFAGDHWIELKLE